MGEYGVVVYSCEIQTKYLFLSILAFLLLIGNLNPAVEGTRTGAAKIGSFTSSVQPAGELIDIFSYAAHWDFDQMCLLLFKPKLVFPQSLGFYMKRNSVFSLWSSGS